MEKFNDIHKYIRLEFIIWFFILCLVVTGVRIHRHNKAKELVTYQLFMPDVDGIIVGSPVKFMGVQVGYVDKIKMLCKIGGRYEKEIALLLNILQRL